MLNFIKIFLTLSFFRYHKQRLLVIIISLILITITVFISDDIIKIVSKDSKLMVVLFKWAFLLILSGLIITNLLKIFNIKQQIKDKAPIEIEQSYSPHKRRILQSTSIESKGESIIKKYQNKGTQDD